MKIQPFIGIADVYTQLLDALDLLVSSVTSKNVKKAVPLEAWSGPECSEKSSPVRGLAWPRVF